MKLTFGDCVLDLSARQLARGGKIVPLEPKMYQLLEALIKRRGAVVTNGELDEILWPEVYVARTSLTRLVSELRSVLGDTPRDSRIIRTVYKTGYAFCASVTSVSSARHSPTTVELVWNKQLMPLSEGEHIAGRDALCSVVIDATTVSRRHARITVLSEPQPSKILIAPTALMSMERAFLRRPDWQPAMKSRLVPPYFR